MGGSDNEDGDYDEKVKRVCAIAKPLASEKLCKKVLKLVKLASKAKQVKRGVKEVVKGLRKGAKGICVLAGDISPIDVLVHVPVLCEQSDVPYIYVPSKEDLGAAGQTKRPTSCMLVLLEAPKKGGDADKSAKVKEAYGPVLEKVTAVQPVF